METKKSETSESKTSATPEQKEKAGIATKAQNDKLQHSEGGITTRDDKTDLGVPMLQGSGDEPVGPEDALGVGAKRGDYTNRIGGSSYQPHEIVPVENAKDGEASVEVQAQRPRTANIGDEAGVKGGVSSEGK